MDPERKMVQKEYRWMYIAIGLIVYVLSFFFVDVILHPSGPWAALAVVCLGGEGWIEGYYLYKWSEEERY